MALLPLCKFEMSHVVFDASCVCWLYKRLYPESPLRYDDTQTYRLAHNDFVMARTPAVFAELFNVARLRKRIPNPGQLNYTFTTNGEGLCVHVVKFYEYTQHEPAYWETAREPVTRHVRELRPGLAYCEQNKYVERLEQLRGWTVKGVDPGINDVYCLTSVLVPPWTEDEPAERTRALEKERADVRNTKASMSSRSWYVRTRAWVYSRKKVRCREREMHEVDAALGTAPFGRSCDVERYLRYLRVLYEQWDAIWAFLVQRKRRKHVFKQKRLKQRELDREVDKVCRPRVGDDQVRPRRRRPRDDENADVSTLHCGLCGGNISPQFACMCAP